MEILQNVRKVPAGMMVVPMVLGSLINTFVPEIVKIGSFTTATFTSAGTATAIGIQLFCLGTTLQLSDMPKVLKRGGLLLIAKFIIGAAIGIFGIDDPGGDQCRHEFQWIRLSGFNDGIWR